MKAFFLSRLYREKVLLTALILFAAVMWLNSLIGRSRTFVQAFNRTSSVLADQKYWLDQREAIMVRSKAVVENFDPSRTYNGVALQAEMDQIARTVGIANTSAEPGRTDRATDLTMYSVQFTIRNSDYASLVRFYQELMKRSPYIGLDSFRVTANQSNPAQLSALFSVSSVDEVSR